MNPQLNYIDLAVFAGYWTVGLMMNTMKTHHPRPTARTPEPHCRRWKIYPPQRPRPWLSFCTRRSGRRLAERRRLGVERRRGEAQKATSARRHVPLRGSTWIFGRRASG